MSKNLVPAVDGMFTMDFDNPQLIGGRDKVTGSYYFPKDLSGSDPHSVGTEDRSGASIHSWNNLELYNSKLPSSAPLIK